MKLRVLLLLSLLLAYPVVSPATVPFAKTVIDSVFTGSSEPAELRVADMDGDADLDIVAVRVDYGGSNDRVFLYVNDGSENFTRLAIDSTIVDPYALAVGDIDDDTDTDVVVGNNDNLYLFLNGGGTFTRTTIDPLIGPVRQIRFGRVDGDVDMDLVVLGNNGVFWEENDGSESFTRRTIDGMPVTDTGLAVADFDGDADLDVVSSVYDVGTGDSWCSRYTNDGTGSFTRYIFDVHQVNITDLILDRIDLDALPDVLSCEWENNRMLWYPADGTPYVSVVGADFNQAPARARVTDIDNDTDKDVVVVGGNSAVGEVVYYENDGFWSFTKRTVDATAGNRVALDVADIDGNLSDDLFVLNAFPHQLVMYKAPGSGSGVQRTPGAGAQLDQNFPNPFNPATTITFALDGGADVVLEVVSARGEKVRTLMTGRAQAGPHSVRWDGRDDRGVVVGSGVYFYRLCVDGRVLARKMVVLK